MLDPAPGQPSPITRFLRDWGPAGTLLGFALIVLDGAYSGKPVYRAAFCAFLISGISLLLHRALRRAQLPDKWDPRVRAAIPWTPLIVFTAAALAIPASRTFCCTFITTTAESTALPPPSTAVSPSAPPGTEVSPPPTDETPTADPSAAPSSTETPTPEPSPTAFGGGSPLLAFEASFQGNLEIFSLALGQTLATPVNLTSNTFNDYDPSFSPFGNAIAFVSDRDGNTEIYTMGPDGSDLSNLTRDPANDYEPAWSPDGSQLVFSSYRSGGDRNIFTLRLSDLLVQQLTSDPACDAQPTWSPGGDVIVFASNRLDPTTTLCDAGDIDLIEISVATGETKRLTSRPIPETHPSFSPDGSTIAFVSTLAGSFDVFTIDSLGFNLNRLTMSSAPDRTPSWSPDGTLLVFVSDRSGARTIYRMSPDGTHVTSIVPMPNVANPSWSP